MFTDVKDQYYDIKDYGLYCFDIPIIGLCFFLDISRLSQNECENLLNICIRGTKRINVGLQKKSSQLHAGHM